MPSPALPSVVKPRWPGEFLWHIRRRGMLAFLSDVAAARGDFAFFRLAGRGFCLTTDPDTVRRVVVTDAARFTKSHALAGVKAALGDGLLTSDGDLHRTQRRMIAPVFHATAVKAFADDFVTQAARLAGGWRDGQAIDANAAMTELTLRVVTQSLFDTELEAEVAPIGRDMATLVHMFERIRNPLAFLLDRLPFLPSNRAYRAALSRLDTRISGMIRAREGRGPDAGRHDLLSLLLAMRDGHAAMSERQVRDEAVTLFMAGHETTANALIWTWLLLAENPDAESALHAELDAVLDGGRPATADDLSRLKYTRAVVAESMRLRPPAWIIARLCTGDYDVGPHRVPAGTTILMPQFLIHRDPRWWPQPDAFRPERWLVDEPTPSGSPRPKYAYFPFGGGPRSCVGEPFAWMEAVLLLATLARHWRLARTDDRPVELFATITLRPKRAVRMRTERRVAAVPAVTVPSP